MTNHPQSLSRKIGTSWSRCISLSVWIATGFFIPVAHAETKLDFWHAYLHQPSGIIHYSFQVAAYKRGLFFGSCGPSTRSLQWEFDIDLAGPGPVYQSSQVLITGDLKKVEVATGSISIDAKAEQATIRLRVKSNTGSIEDFRGNGVYRIRKLN